jgi:hypothetical protein
MEVVCSNRNGCAGNLLLNPSRGLMLVHAPCMQVQRIAAEALSRCAEGAPLQTLWRAAPAAGAAPLQDTSWTNIPS